VFGEGQFRPGTRAGLWLLAHELAHVVQQGGALSMPPRGVGDAGDPLEREADQAADRVAAGRSLPPGFAFGAAPAGAIQRHPGPNCPGFGINNPDQATVQVAESLIELAYARRPGATPVDIVAYGSNNLQFPEDRAMGGQRYDYAMELLATVNGWPAENRPNIID